MLNVSVFTFLMLVGIFVTCLILIFLALSSSSKLFNFEKTLSLNLNSSFQDFSKILKVIQKNLENNQEKVGREISIFREEQKSNEKNLREEMRSSIRGYNQSIGQLIHNLFNSQGQQFSLFEKRLSEGLEKQRKNQETFRDIVEMQFQRIQEENTKKLEEMRQTVNEKLQGTLEKRLSESFRQVSQRLEHVHKSLGEMQELTNGVGDLKRILTNVKTRGTWGEYQLRNILEEILTPDQYQANVFIKRETNEMVDYAVKMPGNGEDSKSFVFLPIDSKFPQEDYLKIVASKETSDPQLKKIASQKLELLIKKEARTIKEKYINPPMTTPFAVMFLPTESLYAEVLSLPGLAENLQREFRVLLSGPTVLAALLSSMSVGFKTLAIQKRTSEIWNLLGMIKTQFGDFTDLLENVQKKLHYASSAMDKATKKSRTIEKKLTKVEQMPTVDKNLLM